MNIAVTDLEAAGVPAEEAESLHARLADRPGVARHRAVGVIGIQKLLDELRHVGPAMAVVRDVAGQLAVAA